MSEDEVVAEYVGEGFCVVSPDGAMTAPVGEVTWEVDEARFRIDESVEPTAAVLHYEDGDVERFRVGTVLRVVWHESADPDRIGTRMLPVPQTGVLADLCGGLSDDRLVQRLTRRLGLGFFADREESLQQLSELAYLVFITYGRIAEAEQLCSWVMAERFRHDYRLWDPVSGLLSLGRWLAQAGGDQVKDRAYAAALVAADRVIAESQVGTGPWREPNLSAEEIVAAVVSGDSGAEWDWRAAAVEAAVVAWASGGTPGHPVWLLEEFIAAQLQVLRGLR